MKSTPLSSFGVPYLEHVLDELFGVPPPGWFGLPAPLTVEEVAARCGRGVDAVAAQLVQLAVRSVDIEIEADDLATVLQSAAAVALVDVREPSEFDRAHLPSSILLAAADCATLLPRLQATPAVVVICQDGARAFSAAHWLREHGVPQARSLRGGLEAWVTRVDRSLLGGREARQRGTDD